MKNQFIAGDTVVWNPENFNPDYWDSLSEELRVRYYGDLGYGQNRPKHFTFICHHRPQHGHCVLISMDDQKIFTMAHTSEFDLVEEEDC